MAVSFDVQALTGSASNFGISVRAPNGGGGDPSSNGIQLSFDVSAPDAGGTRTVTVAQGTTMAPSPAPPGPQPWIAKKEVLAYMNDTDLGSGDYHSTHLPAHTDPHACAALCLKDPKCMVRARSSTPQLVLT